MIEITVKFDPTNGGDVGRLQELANFFVTTPVMTPQASFAFASEAKAAAEGVNYEKSLSLANARSTADAPPTTTAPAATAGVSSVLPNVPQPPVLGNTPALEVDAEGLPWDERIHSGNKTKVQAGTWTRRRNIPDEYYESIRNELRLSRPAPGQQSGGTRLLHQNDALPQFGASSVAAEPPAPPVAQAPLPPQPDVRVPTPPAVAINPFVALAQRVTAGIKSGAYTQDTIVQLIASLNNPQVTKLADFVAHHEVIPAMNAMLDTLG
jgi:hypothetical protein